MLTTENSCDHDTHPGWLLVSTVVFWSEKENPFLLSAVVFSHSGGRGYMTRPANLKGWKCEKCLTFRIRGDPSCAHDFSEGYLFPFATLLWWNGDAEFRPGFFWPFSRRDSTGKKPEVVFAPGFRISIVYARCRARKCNRCGAVELRRP